MNSGGRIGIQTASERLPAGIVFGLPLRSHVGAAFLDLRYRRSALAAFTSAVICAAAVSSRRNGSRELQNSHSYACSDVAGQTLRSNALHTCFEWITSGICAPSDLAYRAELGDLVSGPPNHPWRPGSDTSVPVRPRLVKSRQRPSAPQQALDPLSLAHGNGGNKIPLQFVDLDRPVLPVFGIRPYLKLRGVRALLSGPCRRVVVKRD